MCEKTLSNRRSRDFKGKTLSFFLSLAKFRCSLNYCVLPCKIRERILIQDAWLMPINHKFW